MPTARHLLDIELLPAAVVGGLIEPQIGACYLSAVRQGDVRKEVEGAHDAVVRPVASVVVGVTSAGNFSKLGRLAYKTFLYFFSTMLLAVDAGNPHLVLRFDDRKALDTAAAPAPRPAFLKKSRRPALISSFLSNGPPSFSRGDLVFGTGPALGPAA